MELGIGVRVGLFNRKLKSVKVCTKYEFSKMASVGKV